MTQEYKPTRIYSEPNDVETLYFQPSWHASEKIISQSVAIAPLKNRETSIIFSKLSRLVDTDADHQFVHFCFTEEETDMLIEALQMIKKRWAEGKVI
jgi:hypothetical protein